MFLGSCVISRDLVFDSENSEKCKVVGERRILGEEECFEVCDWYIFLVYRMVIGSSASPCMWGRLAR